MTDARERAWQALIADNAHVTHAQFLAVWDAAKADTWQPCGVPTEPGWYFLLEYGEWSPMFVYGISGKLKFTDEDERETSVNERHPDHWRRLRMPPPPGHRAGWDAAKADIQDTVASLKFQLDIERANAEHLKGKLRAFGHLEECGVPTEPGIYEITTSEARIGCVVFATSVHGLYYHREDSRTSCYVSLTPASWTWRRLRMPPPPEGE